MLFYVLESRLYYAGVYASEMTHPDIQNPQITDAIAKGIMPVPAGRGGT